MSQRPHLNPAQMFNMSFGFLGIQFGWGLQLANMSAVYEKLGARPDQVPILWLAAPLTGFASTGTWKLVWRWRKKSAVASDFPATTPRRFSRWWLTTCASAM